jgi:hypothetical protein
VNADQLIAMIENVLSTTEEASVVAPWLQAAAMFGYGLGYLVLGETRSPLSPHQMLGGVAIVTGTIILSLSDGFRAGGFKLRLAGLMLTCAFILAISTTIFKGVRSRGRVLDDDSYGPASGRHCSASHSCFGCRLGASSPPCCVAVWPGWYR